MKSLPPQLIRWQVKEIAALCRVSMKTAQRWKDGQIVPPATALALLGRDLGCFHPLWSGWLINPRGELCSPENWITTPGGIRAQQFHHTLAAALREEIQTLRSQLAQEEIERYEEQPLPENWTWDETQTGA